MKVNIRQEAGDDFDKVFEVNRLAFGQENEARLVNLLRESDAFVPDLSLVAACDNEIVGHILFTKISIVSDNGHETESLALAPMAVTPKFQRKGIGGQLILRGLEVASRLQFKSVIVLGHEHYYPKFGFMPAERWNIRPPFNVPSNVFMALELVPNALSHTHGIVKYPKEFSAV